MPLEVSALCCSALGVVWGACSFRRRNSRFCTRTSENTKCIGVDLDSETGVPLFHRLRALCDAGHAQLCRQGPAGSMPAKSLVVHCSSDCQHSCTAVLCVLPLSQRLSLERLGTVLSVVGVTRNGVWCGDLRPTGLMAPNEAESIVGCPMGQVPPAGIEPSLPVVIDSSFFSASAVSRSLVAGAAHPDFHLAIEPKKLQSLTNATVAPILADSDDQKSRHHRNGANMLSQEQPLLSAGIGLPSDIARDLADAVDLGETRTGDEDAPIFPPHEAGGPAVHLVAVVAAVRRIGRGLAFIDLLPPGTPEGADRALWRHPNGSGARVRLQLILGRSLALRLGENGLIATLKRLRPRQLLYVGGHVSFKEQGEQISLVPDLPDTVRQKREAQLDAGIVDIVAEQIRVLEEVHVSAEPGGTAGPTGRSFEFREITSTTPAMVEDYLSLDLGARSVHLVDDCDSLTRAERVLRERLVGSADAQTLSKSQMCAESTPSIAVVGVDAEWRPESKRGEASRSPVALLQLAFRRSAFLLDLLTLQADGELADRTTRLVRSCMDAPELLKVGFGITTDLERLTASLPGVLGPQGARSILDLRNLAKAALPDSKITGGLSGLCREVLGRGLNKTEQTSDWAARPLRQEQINYAAQDAHVCVRLFDALCYRHATLAAQPLRPALQSLLFDWELGKNMAVGSLPEKTQDVAFDDGRYSFGCEA